MSQDSKSSAPRGKLSRRGFTAYSAAVGVAVAAGTARAADLPVTESDVSVKTPDGTCDAALFHPSGAGKHPPVLMWTDILGLRPAFRDMGRRLAAQGYVVLVPNPFYRTRKAPVLSGPFNFADPNDRAKLTELTAPLTTPAVTSDAGAYLAFLDAQGATNTKAKAGTVGYCMGGPLTMRTAALKADRIGAGVSCHGGNLVNDTPDSPHLLVPKIKASYYFAVADNDDKRQPDAKDKLKAAFAAAHVPATIEVYDGCQHGWCVKDGAVYNEAGAERAWGNMLALFKGALV
jgi:carboxymethylenebutenolidase